MNAPSAAAFGEIDRAEYRRKIARLLGVLFLATLTVSLALSALILIWVPTSGPPLSLTDGGVNAVDRGSDAERAGLRIGDSLAPNTPFFVREGLANWLYFKPTHFSFDVIRNGRLKHIALTVGHFNFEDNNPTGPEVPALAISIAVFIICAFIGAIVVLVRPMRLTWAFFIYCIGTIPPVAAVQILRLIPLPLGFAVLMVRTAIVVAGLFALLAFALRFPSGEVAGWRKSVAVAVPIFAAAYFVCVCLTWVDGLYPIPVNEEFWKYFFMIVPVTIAGMSITSAAGIYRSSAPDSKQRLKWAILGIVLASVAIGCRAILIETSQFWNLELLGWTTVLGGFLAPLTVAYAILKHRVIDVRFVINRAVVYLVVTSLLAITLGAAFWITNLLLRHTQAATIVQLLAAIAVGVMLHRVYSRLESAINRFLFKSRYAAREHLERIGDGLGRVKSLRELEALVAMEPVVALDLSCGAVYHKNARGNYERRNAAQAQGLPVELEADEPLIARACAHHEAFSLSRWLLCKLGSTLCEQPLVFALPLHSDGLLTALALYGPHQNGADLDPGERAAVAALQAPAERGYGALRRESDKLRRLSELLQSLPDGSTENAHSYLANEMIESIPEQTRFAVAAAAAVPGATGEELTIATENPQSTELLREFATLSPTIRRREDGEFQVHGLLSRALACAYPQERAEMLARCAQHAGQCGHHARASQLFELAGLQGAAVQEQEKEMASCDPALLMRGGKNAGKLVDVDFRLIVSCPHLWIERTASRLFSDAAAVQVREGRNVISSLEGRAPQLLAPWCAYLQAEAGDLPAAGASLQQRQRFTANSAFTDEFAGMVAALVAGRLGRLDACADQLRALATGECRALNAIVRSSIVERAHGAWNSEFAGIEYAIQELKALDSRFVIWALAEGVVGAWIAGQQHEFDSLLKQLESAATRYDARSMKAFIAAASHRPVGPNGSESPRWLAFAHLMVACHAESWDEAKHFATIALENALASNEPLLQTLARIACAHLDEARCNEHLRGALQISERIDSVELGSAVRSIVAGEQNAGMLQHFVAGLYRDRGPQGVLAIDMASGTVRRGPTAIALSERELALAFALARSHTATSAAELCDLIWPDLNESAGLHAVQSYVHRLRRRLADPDAVQSNAHGYRLRDDTVVDIFAIEGFIRNIPADEALDQFTALRLAAVANHLDSTRPAYMAHWDWFAPIERRINEWSRAAKYRLAQEALRLGEYDRVVGLSQKIRDRDELDEPAWEIAIRALVESGNRAQAQRELRRYREIMLRELDAEPSRELYDLLEWDTTTAADMRISR